MKATRRFASAGFLVLLAIGTGLVASEMAARLVLEPSDYLSVTIVQDDILGIRIAPAAPGFDDWGFRNRHVPVTADVVAVGDSHTYGNNATMADSWPAVTARATGLSVYNLGLGGYGPNQYYHLLKMYGVKLKPRWVLVGLYMGDDFENAFLMTHGRPYWSFLRQSHWAGDNHHIWQEPVDSGKALANLRNWLSRNSVLYRVVLHGPVLGAVKGAIQINRVNARRDPLTTSLVVREANIQEAFRPVSIHKKLDQHSGAVREGIRITFELLQLMDQLCHQAGCQLVVIMIPTKEMVFADHLLRDRALHLRDVIQQLVVSETTIRQELVTFLGARGIPFVDTLPALRRETSNRIYTRSDGDMHPGSRGYAVIGEAVAEFLKTSAKPTVH